MDAELRALLINVQSMAWLTFKDVDKWSVERRAATTQKLISQLLAAADAGERDFAKLLSAAIKDIPP